jgi:hypothetical protein
MRRVLGVVLIALPGVTLLASMAINRGVGYAITALAVAGLSLACVLGGLHLLAPKKKSR